MAKVELTTLCNKFIYKMRSSKTRSSIKLPSVLLRGFKGSASVLRTDADPLKPLGSLIEERVLLFRIL